MANMNAFYRTVLNRELTRRVSKNPRYSLGAYSRLLGCDTSYLSKLNSGKIILSLRLASNFSESLGLSENEKRDFILSAAEEQKCHALYLLEPSLTNCSPQKNTLNQQPKPRKTKGK
ncbi:MAG: hypothetical protein AB8E15_13550 [Bdellovibrionales bacterium]